MKLLIITTLFYPSKGGVQEVVKNISKYFYNRNTNKVKIITTVHHNLLNQAKNKKGLKIYENLLKLYPGGKESYENIEILRVWMELPRSLLGYLMFPYRFIISFIRILNFVYNYKPHIVNYHFPDDSSIYVGLLLMFFDNFKIITNIHGNDLHIYAKKSPHSFFINYIFSKSTSLIVNSEYMKNEFITKYPSYEHKIVIIPNGLNLESIYKAPKKEYFDQRYAFFIGRMVEKKGLDILLKAFAEADIKNLKLLIEGNGEELERTIKIAQDLNLEGKVEFTKGTLNRESYEDYSYMKGALFGVMPSRIEPFGIVALEMMAAGIPIIASKTGGLNYILEDEKTALLFENGNIEELAEKIKRLSEDQSLRDKLVKNSKEAVKKYDQENINKLYEKEFDRCLRK